jgi:hypothetical protein
LTIERDPNRQYTGDGERENPEAQDGRIEPNEEAPDEDEEPRSDDEDG